MIVISCRWGKTTSPVLYGPWGDAGKKAEDEPQIVAAAKNFFATEIARRGKPPFEAAIHEPECTGLHKMPAVEWWAEGKWK